VRDASVRLRLTGIGDFLVGRCLSLNNHVILVKELNLVILQGLHFVCSFAHSVHLINARVMEHTSTWHSLKGRSALRSSSVLAQDNSNTKCIHACPAWGSKSRSDSEWNRVHSALSL
jgi:hypothetical protein